MNLRKAPAYPVLAERTRNRPLGVVLTAMLLASCGPVANSSAAPNCETELQVDSSRVHGLLLFALAVTEKRYGDSRLRATLMSSPERALSEHEAVQRLRGVDIDQNSYAYPGMPQWHGATVQPFDAYLTLSRDAESLSDLDEDVVGVLPAEDHVAIIDALRVLSESYDSLVWEPNREGLLKLNSEVECKASEVRLQQYLKKVARFYSAPELQKVPVRMATSAIGAPGGYRVTIKGSTVVAPLPKQLDDPIKLLGVVIHEWAHVAYGNQDPKLARQIEHWFESTGKPNQHYAKLWFDEALATAVGNLWAYERMARSPQERQPNASPVISRYAHALVPIVTEYMGSERAIDEEFVKAAALSFEDAFPDAGSDPAVILPHLTVHLDESLLTSRGQIERAFAASLHPQILIIRKLEHGGEPETKNPGTHLTLRAGPPGEGGKGSTVRRDPDGRVLVELSVEGKVDTDELLSHLHAEVAESRESN